MPENREVYFAVKEHKKRLVSMFITRQPIIFQLFKLKI